VDQSIDFDTFIPETMEEQEEYDPDQENDFELSFDRVTIPLTIKN
jgi:hypothetical protein